MALTDYDKQNLTAAQQAGIAAATQAWNEANARGDTAGMERAHAAAENIRNNSGYTSDSSGAYSGSLGSQTSYSAGSSGHSTSDAVSGITNTINKNGTVTAATQTGRDITGYSVNDWTQDNMDYSARAANAQGIEELNTWLSRREMKAAAQGIDISGNTPGIKSNAEIARDWYNTYGNYIDNYGRVSLTPTGSGYTGSYYSAGTGSAGSTGSVGGTGSSVGSAGTVAAGAQRSVSGANSYTGSDLTSQLLNLYSSQNSAYQQQLAAQQAAQEAAVKKAVSALESQKTSTDQQYADLFRQLYVDKMKSQKNLNQQLAASGITGGAAESTRLSYDTAYEDALRQGEQSRIGAISGLDQAITDARLTGDIESAEAAANAAKEQTSAYADTLRYLINRQDTIDARQAAYDREDAQRAEAYAREDAQRAAAYAQQLLKEQREAEEKAEAAAEKASKPTLTVAQVNAAIKAGVLTDAVLAAYKYYYGEAYRG